MGQRPGSRAASEDVDQQLVYGIDHPEVHTGTQLFSSVDTVLLVYVPSMFSTEILLPVFVKYIIELAFFFLYWN